jgi:hypothetical protein
LEQYKQLVSPSEPQAEFHDRNAVYAMKYHVLLSIMYADNKSFRDKMVEELRMLIDRIDLEESANEPRL